MDKNKKNKIVTYVCNMITPFVFALIGLLCINEMQLNVNRVYSIANRNAALSTLNGGEVAFAEQQLIKSGNNSINGLFSFGKFFVLVIFAYTAYKNYDRVFCNNDPGWKKSVMKD